MHLVPEGLHGASYVAVTPTVSDMSEPFWNKFLKVFCVSDVPRAVHDECGV
jgi:hypothetical protein